MTPDQIDHVLLVGEGSHIPLVQSSLAQMFGREKLMFERGPDQVRGLWSCHRCR